MCVYKKSQFWTAVAAAVIWASALSLSYAPIAHADKAEHGPVEMLQDGLDALVERQTDLATQLFEQLILAFPGTDQAIRAERELGALSASGNEKSAGDARGPDARGPEARAALDRRMPASLEALRMKFAIDAGDRVFFAENSAVIGGRARALIDHQARWLATRPELRITVIGRADDGASVDESRDLSAKRAEAVREKLVGSGIEASRITIDARGTRDPVATCRSTLCQAQNRHAETLISVGLRGGDAFGEVDAPSSTRGQATTADGASEDGMALGITVAR